MRKLGFGKKDGGGKGQDGRASKAGSSSGSPGGGANPYAVDSGGFDPYTQPPAAGGASVGSGSQGSRYPASTASSETMVGSQYSYSGGPSMPAGARGRGEAGYGLPSSPKARVGPTGGPIGYGGGGGGGGRKGSQETVSTVSTEAGREALFGGAAQRQQQRQQQQQSQFGPGTSSYGDGGAGNDEYTQQQQQQQQAPLTAEEEEEADALATKQEIRFLKQADVGSTRNALRLAAQAEETGTATLARLGGQGERIHNTERNLDLAASQNRRAEEKAKELKTVNGSMFAVHVGNPFTSARRRDAREQAIVDRHRGERDVRDATRQAHYHNPAAAAAAGSSQTPGQAPGKAGKKAGAADASAAAAARARALADRSKYQFEADSDDENMEAELDENMDQLHGAARRLNLLGQAMGREVEQQNTHIDRIIQKVRPSLPPPSALCTAQTLTSRRPTRSTIRSPSTAPACSASRSRCRCRRSGCRCSRLYTRCICLNVDCSLYVIIDCSLSRLRNTLPDYDAE